MDVGLRFGPYDCVWILRTVVVTGEVYLMIESEHCGKLTAAGDSIVYLWFGSYGRVLPTKGNLR